jgi:hypothetical protein
LKRYSLGSIRLFRVNYMGRYFQLNLLSLLTLALLSIEAEAGPPKSGNSGGNTMTFVPPTDGAPSRRVGAGTRSNEIMDNGVIRLIVPAGGGVTASASPILVWNFSKDVDGELRLELTDVQSQKPWLIFRETGQWKTGLTGLSLADFGVSMEKGQILDWKMSFVPSGRSHALPEVRSFVEYTSADPPQVNADNAMRTFATSGYWFDAVAAGIRVSASDAIELTDPVNIEALLTSVRSE